MDELSLSRRTVIVEGRNVHLNTGMKHFVSFFQKAIVGRLRL